MDIGFFLEYEGQVVQIPVNPELIEVSMDGNNNSTEIITLGEITVIKKRKLSTIKWSSFFPYEDWFPGIRTKGQFESKDFYLQFIEKVRADCKPCRLVVTGIGLTTLVSIESFNYQHQAGDHEDCYYDIELKEYKDYAVSKISIETVTKKPETTTAVGTTAPNTSVTPKPAEITIGCDVILSGTVHYDSYGAKPGKTFTNYQGKVNLMNKKGSHPYHVTTPSGGWLGWVTAESVVLV